MWWDWLLSLKAFPVSLSTHPLWSKPPSSLTSAIFSTPNLLPASLQLCSLLNLSFILPTKLSLWNTVVSLSWTPFICCLDSLQRKRPHLLACFKRVFKIWSQPHQSSAKPWPHSPTSYRLKRQCSWNARPSLSTLLSPQSPSRHASSSLLFGPSPTRPSRPPRQYPVLPPSMFHNLRYVQHTAFGGQGCLLMPLFPTDLEVPQ